MLLLHFCLPGSEMSHAFPTSHTFLDLPLCLVHSLWLILHNIKSYLLLWINHHRLCKRSWGLTMATYIKLKPLTLRPRTILCFALVNRSFLLLHSTAVLFQLNKFIYQYWPLFPRWRNFLYPFLSSPSNPSSSLYNSWNRFYFCFTLLSTSLNSLWMHLFAPPYLFIY